MSEENYEVQSDDLRHCMAGLLEDLDIATRAYIKVLKKVKTSPDKVQLKQDFDGVRVMIHQFNVDWKVAQETFEQLQTAVDALVQ